MSALSIRHYFYWYKIVEKLKIINIVFTKNV